MSEYGNIIVDTFSAGPSQAVGTLDEDPEKAARALELEKATGTPAPVIYGDVENFERQHKAVLAGDIVKNNAFISDYVTKNQMAGRLSNDDYGSLDAVSQATQKLGKRSIMDAAIEGFKRGFGEDHVGGWMVRNKEDLQWVHNNRMAAAVTSVAGFPIEMLFRGVGGAVHGVSEAAGEAAGQLVGNKAQGERLTRDLIKLADVAMPEMVKGIAAPTGAQFNRQLREVVDSARPYIEAGREPPIGVHPEIDNLKIEQSKIDLDNLNEALKEAQASRTRERNPEIFASFIRQHTDAKIGISVDAVQKLYTLEETVPETAARIAELEEKLNTLRKFTELDQAGKGRKQYKGRDDPEYIKDQEDLRQQRIEQNDIAQEIYELQNATKKKTAIEVRPDDGKLGWVQGIREQLESAIAIGGDIEIPLADWLAHVDPELAKELKDDIRVRPGGVTKNEVEGLKAEKQPDPTILADEEGKPLTVFHGSTKEFEAFDASFRGKATGAPSAREGFFFSDRRKTAEYYAGESYAPKSMVESSNRLADTYTKLADDYRKMGNLEKAAEWDAIAQQTKIIPNVKEFNLKIENPLIHDFKGKVARDESYNDLIQKAKAAGHDGVIFQNTFDAGEYNRLDALMQGRIKPETVYVAFDPKQIVPKNPVVDALRKSAGLDSSLRFAFGEEVKRLKLERADELREKLGVEPGSAADAAGLGKDSQFFKMLDPEGLEHGFVELIEQGKNLQIEMIASGVSTGKLSPRVVRDLLTQLKELFPNAETISGYRVSGARAAADKMGVAKIALAAIDPAEVMKLTNYLNDTRKAKWEDIGQGAEVVAKPKEEYTAHERQIEEAVYEVLSRITPHSVNVHTVEKLRLGEFGEAAGLFRADNKGLAQVIIPIAMGEQAPGYARHEAIHALKRLGLFTPTEWSALTQAAKEGGWIEQYGIGKRYEPFRKEYGDQFDDYLLEEAVAHAYHGWAANKPIKELNTIAERAFEKLRRLVDELTIALEQIFGRKPTYDEVFERVEAGDVGSRMKQYDTEGGQAAAKADEPELPGMTRMEDREAFEKASAIGMTVDQYKRYMKLIERRQAEDAAALEDRALKDQKRRLTAEWKEAERDLRPQVLAEINNRPDVAADNFFREGLLYGNKVEATRLSSDHLTPEQIEALPKSYVRVNGIHPDDAASLFGYPNGAALVEALVGINEQRKTYGGRPEEFKRHLVKMELERQMQAKFGDLERNIIEEAKDQVLSQTQLDLLHEETMALGLKAGTEYSITKEQLRGWIGEQFNQTKMEFINSDKFLRDAGKAGRATEDFLLKEKFVDAFKEKQRQYIAVTMATEAKKIEKAKAQLDRVAKTYSRREVPSVEKDYTNYIQGLLQQAGYPIRLSPDEIHANIDASGYASMPDFIAEKQSFGWEPAVSEDIQHNGVKPIEQMTATEFREFKDAIDSLNYIGRQERKIEILGEKLDWEEYRKSVLDNVSQLPVRPRESQGRWLYEVDASLTRMEEIVKDLDLRQELGPIFNAVIEPMMASKAKSFDLLTDLSKFFRETKGEFGKAWRKTLNDTIPQDFLIDPYYRQPYDLTRENLIQIMLNWGNRSNIEKFARGHASLELGRIATKEETAAFADRVKALIDQHATKEDWDFVQRMWEPFKKFQPMTDQVARNTSGVVPKWIQPEPVVTPHGTFEGGYWPVKYDRLGSDLNVIEDRKGSGDQLFGPSYFRAATAKGHLKERTGYVDFVDINTSIEQAAGVMQQTIHDIAYRDALMQASKVFYDKPIRAAIRKHYGSEYEAQLIPWLKRIANQYSVDERPIKGYNDWLRRARVNLIGHALPLNLKVIFSPDIGTLNPASWTRFEANRGFNEKLALEKSNEIRHLVYNMDRDFREQLDQIVTKQTYSSIQTEAVRWGFKPMMKFSQEFRMATFVDQYNKAKARGLNDHEASVVADSYVRERHGAASVVDLPAIMANSESLKTLTMFYGFFNTMYNWQRQLPGNLRRQEYKDFMINGTGSVLVGAAFGAALFNQSKQDDSWWKIIAKALLIQPLSTVPVVRDIANFIAEGYHSRSPIASAAQAGLDIGKDIVRWMEKKPVKKPIQHAANVVGLSTGLPLMQPGKTSQFLWDVGQRKQQPRNILEWWRGIVTGEAKLKK